jgi:hypothetical protein
MGRTYDRVCQFKIVLDGIKPEVWRRILVPGPYSFWDLHVAIQDSMGWKDHHLHEYELINPLTGKTVSIGIPNNDFDDSDKVVLPGWDQKISDYLRGKNSSAKYKYDFGDCWLHDVILEAIKPRANDIHYPTCIGGERACPPEDCGGVAGYQDFLSIIMDPANEQYREMLNWAGGEFYPEDFDPAKITFSDPRVRLMSVI